MNIKTAKGEDYFDLVVSTIPLPLVGEIFSRSKIDKSIVGGFGWTDHGLANIVNDYILDSAQKNHNLIPLCSLDINSKKSEEELIKCISRGVKGIGELHLEYDEIF